MTDLVIQRVIEFILLNSHVAAMALSVALPPTWTVVQAYFGIVIILSLVGWTGLAWCGARQISFVPREEDFVMAAQLNGANERIIIFKHLLPLFYSHIIASLTLSVPGMIIGETALSFIGLGAPTAGGQLGRCSASRTHSPVG